MTDRDLTSYSDPLSVVDDVDINEHLTADQGEYVEAADRAAGPISFESTAVSWGSV